jgi:protein SCO1
MISVLIVSAAVYGLWQYTPSNAVRTTEAGVGQVQQTTLPNATLHDAMSHDKHSTMSHDATSHHDKSEGMLDVGGAFSLMDVEGKPVTEEALKGSFSLVYFGFTSCPDICPTTLQAMTVALNKLGSAGEKIIPVFITIDPARDTPEVMKAFASNFHPRLLALTGTEEQVEDAAKAYKVFYKLHNETDKKNYVVDHSGFVYLMSPTGEYLTHFAHDEAAENIMALLTKYIR